MISIFHQMLFEKKLAIEMKNNGIFSTSGTDQPSDNSGQDIQIEMKNLLSVETFTTMHAQINQL